MSQESPSRNRGEPDEFEVRCQTAGNYPSNDLTVSTHIVQCGKIKDGVSFCFGARGGWVLTFADLERIYLTAARRRMVKAKARGK